MDVSDRPATTALRTRRRTDGVAAVAALAVLVLGMVAVRHGSVSAPERRIFHAINDLPGALYPVLWPFQQLGVLIAGPIVALVALVCLTRVYVGAHNPLDVVCGAALGLAIGGMINLGIGVPPEVRR